MVEYKDDMNLLLKAISDPVRRKLLDDLRLGPKTVTVLAEPFAMSFAGISKHMQYLLKANLVSRRKNGRESIYCLNADPLRELQSWVEQYQSFWTERLDVLEQLIEESNDE